MSRRVPLLVVAGVAVAVAVMFVLLGIASGGPKPSASPVLVCVDSTASTDGVRESYGDDLEAVAGTAAEQRARFYAAPCGANATGSVNWPVKTEFGSSLSGVLGDEQVENQLRSLTGRLDELTQTTSTQQGTPFGEMLAVAARQCQYLGGGCTIYMFTDGEWADGLLRVGDGVSEGEQAAYLDAYRSRVGDLDGTEVNFVGVGFGTHIGEVRLAEARAVAEALVFAASGEMGTWTVSL